MKKLLFLISLITFNLSLVKAQSFHTGTFVLGANFGIDGDIANRHYFNTSENSAQTLNGTAPASNFNITAEVGLLRWLGVGVIGRFDNYFPQSNGVTESSPSAGAVDLGLTANLHLLTFDRFDLLGGFDYGYSHLTYNTNNESGTSSSSNGSWGDIHATARIYITKMLGFNLNVYTPMMSYHKFRSSNETVGTYVINDWEATGYGASIGVQVKL
jgi:opacity protein-like surface antigen